MGIISKSVSRTLGIAAALSAAMLACTAWATPQATGSGYDISNSGLLPRSVNMLRGLTPEFGDSDHSWYINGGYYEKQTSDFGCLTDGMIPNVENGDDSARALIPKDSTLTWTWDVPRPLELIRIYTRWQDGYRNDVSVQSIEVFTNGGWTTLANSSFCYARRELRNTVPTYNHDLTHRVVTFADSEGAYLASNVTGIRITFGDQSPVDGNGEDATICYGAYWEIEAKGGESQTEIDSFSGGVLLDMLHLGADLKVNIPSSLGGIATDFLSTVGGETRVVPQPGDSVTLGGVEYVWTEFHNNRANGRWFDNNEDVNNYNAYLHTCIYVSGAEEKTVRWRFAHDDGMRAWLNGEVLHKDDQYVGEPHIVEGTLRPGFNSVMFKLNEGTGGDFIHAELSGPEGAQLDGVGISPAPVFLVKDRITSNTRCTSDTTVDIAAFPKRYANAYMITTSPAAPVADDPGWQQYSFGDSPATATFAAPDTVPGKVTLYAWFKTGEGTITGFPANLLIYDTTPPVVKVKDFTCVVANPNVGTQILLRDIDDGIKDETYGIHSITIEPSIVKTSQDVVVTVVNNAGVSASATAHITALPGSGTLPAGYIQTMLHLGHSLATDDLAQTGGIGGDQLSDGNGRSQTTMKPYPGMVVTGLATSGSSREPAGQLTWTPAHVDQQRWRPSYDGDGRNNYIKYWHIYIISPDEREVDWRHLSDDGMRLWVNGELQVRADGVSNTTTPGRLYAGLNSIMVKLEEGSGDDYLDLALRKPGTSEYFDDLRYALEPGSFKVGCPETGRDSYTGRAAVSIIDIPIVTSAVSYQCVLSSELPAADGWKTYSVDVLPEDLVTFETPAEGGSLKFKLYLRDSEGASVGEYESNEIIYTQVEPVAKAKDATLRIDSVNGTVVKPSDIDDGSSDALSGIFSMSVSPAKIYAPGEVTLYVTNNAGLVDTATVNINPAFWCDFSADEVSGLNTLDATFTARVFGSETALEGLIYTWTFGDGTSVTGSGAEYASVEHTFANPGNYSVTLSVKNGSDEVAEASQEGMISVLNNRVYLSKTGRNVYPYDTAANAATNPHDALSAADDAIAFGAENAVITVGPGTYEYQGALQISNAVTFVSTDGPEATTFSQTKDDTRAFYVDNASALVSGLTVTSKRLTSDKRGTAFYLRYGTVSNVVVTACTGGGHGNGGHQGCVYITHGLLVDSLITNNRDSYNSAAVYVDNADAVVDRCEISFNYGNQQHHSSDGGGGVRLINGTVRNCFIHDNETKYHPGGGVRMGGGLLENCTIVNNKAGVDNSGGGGGGLRHDGGTVRNCIIWNNLSLGAQSDYDGSGATFSCAPELSSGTGNVSANPGFADAANTNFTLLASSPCVDAGTAIDERVVYDFAGNERVMNALGVGEAKIDMGAWEFSPDADAFGCSFVVNSSTRGLDTLNAVFEATATGPTEKTTGATYAWDFGDGTTSPASTSGNLVEHRYEAPGMYNVTLTVASTGGETATFMREDCIMIVSDVIYVRGGSAAAEFPYATVETAAASVGEAYSAAQIAVECGANSVLVDVGPGEFPLTAELRLDGPIRIVGAGRDATVLWMVPTNARIAYLGNAGAMVANLVISNGVFATAASGGGLYIHDGTASNVVVTCCRGGEHANSDGLGAGLHGAVYMDGGTLVDSAVRGNRNNYNGAALFVNGSGAFVDRCEICDNYGNDHDWAGDGGSGIELRYGTVRNSFIHGNEAGWKAAGGSVYGAGVYVRYEGILESCTVIGNKFRYSTRCYGGGVYQNGGKVLNCIIADNWKDVTTESPSASDYEADGQTRDVTYTYAPELSYGTGNVTGEGVTAPLFRNVSRGDFRPGTNGAATRTGLVQEWMRTGLDFNHARRVIGSSADMGAFARFSDGFSVLIR